MQFLTLTGRSFCLNGWLRIIVLPTTVFLLDQPARPGMGKSVMGFGLATFDALRDGGRVALFSLEMTISEYGQRSGELCINPIIYAEVWVGFERIEALDEALSPEAFLRLPLPWEAGFLAGKAFMRYRKARGARTSPLPLPDFYIGAHAAIDGLTLLTRDAPRYRSHFPTVELICPP